MKKGLKHHDTFFFATPASSNYALMKKGLKPWCRHRYARHFWFELRPDEEGIETRTASLTLIFSCSNYALMKKGLKRKGRQAAPFSFLGSNYALMKKGLKLCEICRFNIFRVRTTP